MGEFMKGSNGSKKHMAESVDDPAGAVKRTAGSIPPKKLPVHVPRPAPEELFASVHHGDG